MNKILKNVVEQKLLTKQIPRIACRLLALNQQELNLELRKQAELNPVIEINKSDHANNFYISEPQITLTEFLVNQLEKTPLTTNLRKDAINCVSLLDEHGYLPSIQTIKQKTGFNLSRTKKAVTVIRQLQPVGVGAFNLADSMLLQLTEMPTTKIVTQAIYLIKNHFDNLIKRRFDLLPPKDLSETLKLIESLNPDVSSNFSVAAEYLIPDLKATKVKGVWKVFTYDQQPKVFINQSYRNIPKNESNANWRRLVHEANSLLAAIDFRQATLIKVAQVLVDEQRDFFEYDKKHLKPIRLVDVAKKTNLAISTISTTLNNKSISTPSGVITLKYLLQRKTAGDNLSAIALQEAIKELVRHEDTNKPLSDISIMQQLNIGSNKPSRRTVAKHRHLAGILPAYLRKVRIN